MKGGGGLKVGLIGDAYWIEELVEERGLSERGACFKREGLVSRELGLIIGERGLLEKGACGREGLIGGILESRAYLEKG
jgi:hypothetical protein